LAHIRQRRQAGARQGPDRASPKRDKGAVEHPRAGHHIAHVAQYDQIQKHPQVRVRRFIASW